MCCSVISVVWSIVVAIVSPRRFCTAPCEIRITAIASESGIRIRTIVRVRSTQKLPRLREPVRVMPRIRPITTAMPAAADTKFWTVNPII